MTLLANKHSVMIGRRRFKYSFWDGERLGRIFAFDTETPAIEEHEIPELSLAAASDGTHHVLIHPDQIDEFIQIHRNRHWVFHNVAFDFWVLHQHMRDKSQLWTMVDKFHDSMIMDMLIRLARFDEFPVPRDLGTVSLHYARLKIDKQDPYRLRYREIIGKSWLRVAPGFFRYAIKDPITTFAAYRKMYNIAERIVEGSEAATEYGLLSEEIQIKAAIVLSDIHRRGMRLDLAKIDQLSSELHRDVDRVTKRLLPFGFINTDEDGLVVLTQKSQTPSIKQKALQTILLHIADEHELRIPETSRGLSLSTKVWSEYRSLDNFLDDWIQLKDKSKLCGFFKALTERVIHPKYTIMVRTGRVSCNAPNIQQMPRQSGIREAFIPRSGHVFLTVDYSFIELRTLAAVCLDRYGESRLADVICDGIDPHAYTAALLNGLTLKKFNRLKNRKALRQAAKAINFGVPGGLVPSTLASYAKSTYGVDMTDVEAEQFYDRLTTEIYPELSWYLTEDTLAILAANLNTTKSLCRTVLGKNVGGIRRLVGGSKTKVDGTPYSTLWTTRIWQRLGRLSRNPEISNMLAKRQAGSRLQRLLFYEPVQTLTGRIRGRTSYTQSRNTPFSGLAADGAKLALWELLKSGYQIAAFVHDEVIIELPKARDYLPHAKNVVRIMSDTMGVLTNPIPVECEFAVSERWHKDAEAVYKNGRLVAWS